ncbi:MAG: phytoene desaturase family protein [Dongiaceae bacterium]
MSGQYDAIVVGGGHNGLTAAGYLAKAGRRVLVLERRSIVGGAAVTEEIHPGYRCSIASYVVSLLRDEVVRDLELKRHGYETIPMSAVFVTGRDGKSLFITGDPANDQAEFGKFSNRDYEALRIFNARLAAAAGVLREQMLREPPALANGGIGDFLAMLKLGAGFRRLKPEERQFLLQLFTTPVGDLLDRWFDSEIIKVKFAASAAAGACISLRQPGSAINLLHLSIGAIDGAPGAWALAKGGMGAITKAMAAAARGFGAEIRTDAAVARVMVECGRATGVRLETGEQLKARFVLANTDPKRTFLKLVGEEHLESEFAADIRAFRVGSGTYRMNIALNGVPEFATRPGAAIGPHHQSFIRLMDSTADFERAWVAAQSGEPPPVPLIDVVIPTALDDSLAPPGCHVMSLLCQQYPYQLSGGRSWDQMREPEAQRIIDTVERHVPNIRRIMVGHQAMSPLDLERIFGLTHGDVYHGRLDPDQLFSLRPHPRAAQYRTPIAGLYLCGAGAHPGGGVSGAPGHNCARRVLKDWNNK